jgi:hypothetical protein
VVLDVELPKYLDSSLIQVRRMHKQSVNNVIRRNYVNADVVSQCSAHGQNLTQRRNTYAAKIGSCWLIQDSMCMAVDGMMQMQA